MALLQVRNFPDDTYEEISKIAKKERRSIAQQTILLVEKAIKKEDTPRERMLRALERTTARPVPDWLKGIDSAASIREDRDSR